MEVDSRNEFTFIWRIENFTYCPQTPFESITSPVFIVNSLNKSRWCIRLYPNSTDNLLQFYLVNVTPKGDKFVIDYQLSLVDSGGTVLNPIVIKNSKFVRDAGKGMDSNPTLKEVCETKRSIYLPQDTLTVFCRLWTTHKGEDIAGGYLVEKVQCHARTQIGVKRLHKLWSIQDFKGLADNGERTTTVALAGDGTFPVVLKVSSEGESVLERWLNIEISRETSIKSSMSCKISMLNCFGKCVKAVQDRHRFLPNGELVWTFPKFISCKELLERKSDVLFGNALSLEFEFVLSSGEEHKCVEGTSYGTPNVDSVDRLWNPPGHSYNEHHKVIDLESCMASDMLSLYQEKTLSDFRLTAGGITFPVHKAVLCARSPVFKAMLTSDMLESDSKSLNVPDLDAYTLSRLLLYIYADTVEQLDWESASMLYYAADKYQVLPLRNKCSAELKSLLTIQNVSVILEVGDRHQDADLTSAVHDFLLVHDKELMKSKEWLKFVEENTQLAATTMYVLYRKKLEMLS